MTTITPKSREELRALSEKELLAYFTEHAHYYPESPESSKYAIRTGASSLFSHDTAELAQKFHNWVHLNDYDVFRVKKRNGEWEHRAYRVVDGERTENPPKTLETKFALRVEGCRNRIEAVRTAITKLFGD